MGHLMRGGMIEEVGSAQQGRRNGQGHVSGIYRLRLGQKWAVHGVGMEHAWKAKWHIAHAI